VRYKFDTSVRRAGDGTVLIGGSPLKLLRLTGKGGELLDSIERGESVPSTPGNNALINRLLDGGIVHPRPDHLPAADTLAVTVVIPAFNTPSSDLTRLVQQCQAQSASGVAAVLIVDDASQPPLGDIAGATTIRRETNGGPGAARSTGLDQVATPLVAFVDADVDLGPDWLQPLLDHFADNRVALVAPRVASMPGASLLAQYETLHSPLDLGPTPARVRAGTRVSYVPSAALVCRVSALREVGGFDPSLRVGEDVDLVWRLDEASYGVRYEPAVTVTHRPRSSFRAWAKQRFDYGTSAAPLATRHAGSLAPVRVSGWSAATWLAIATGLPIVGGLIAVGTTALLARKLRTIPDGTREAVRLAGLGHVFAGRSLASAVTRAWWPLAALAALVSKRARYAVLVAALAPTSFDWINKRPSIDPLRYVALRLLDDMAYGAGLATGALKARSLNALQPDFTSWPRNKK